MEMENLYSYSTDKNKKGKRKYKKKTWFSRLSRRKKAIFISSICIACAALFAVTGILIINAVDYNHNPLNEEELGAVSVLDAGITNIALFGIDTREMKDFTGRSDSIMILSVNANDNKVKIISVMRDSFVPVGDGYGKINSAYSEGGPTLAVKTLNTIFGLDIRDYATVNFYGMEDIIDAVGGLEIDVQKNEIEGSYRLNDLIMESAAHQGVKNPKLVKSAGLQTLNGMQAVAWARIRYASTVDGVNDDFGRTDRQRMVMNALFNKALNMNASGYPKLIKALLPCTETSLTYSEIIKLAGIFLKDVSFEEMRIAMPEYIIDADYRPKGESCVYYNLDYAAKMLHAFIYENVTPEDFMDINGVDKTRWHGYSGSTGSSGGGTGSSGNSGNSGGTTSGSTSSGGMTIIDTSSDTSSTLSGESETSSVDESNQTSSEDTNSEATSSETASSESGSTETSSSNTSMSE